MPGFNDWLSFDPTPMAAIDRYEEVDSAARDRLAKDLQTRLRGRVDPGIDAATAARAQAVRVHSEGDRLVIDQEDQAGVLDAAGGSVGGGDQDSTEVTSVDQLFELGSGVPRIVEGQGGELGLVFKSISVDNLFGAQRQAEQDLIVEQTTMDSLRSGVADAFEEAINDVNRRYPESR